MIVKFVWDPKREMGVVEGELFDSIREHFSVENQSAKFNRNNPWIPARKYAITPTGRFEPGMLPLLIKYIQEKHPGAVCQIDDTLAKRLTTPLSVQGIADTLAISLRPYQRDIVDVCIKRGYGTVVLATAGGKTLTTASLITSVYNSNPQVKCLLIVPDIGLVKQTYSDFQEYKVPFTCSMWMGKHELNLGTNVIVANLGILQSANSNTDWIEDVDLLIIDEVHKLRKDNKFNKIIDKVKTKHRFGLTGTLPENLLDKWNIIGKIGPVIYEKHAESLQTEKYVAPAKAIILQLKYKVGPRILLKEEIKLPGQKYKHEIDWLIQNEFRNGVIGTLCNKLDNNVLVMVDYITHGETLFATLQKYCPNKKVFFIRGDVEVEDRRKVIEMMEVQQDVVCVAISKIFSTGINIKQLNYIVFAAGGKAKVRVIQSIGRGRRLHENKTELMIFDLADQLKYGSIHAARRQKLYHVEKIPFAFKDVHEK